ncbi:unnamed protein product [Adineta steineri]|uniref:RING-type domain-containing protein n=1 Tax=Adineta steineri TaxID=433720 RepID=A0A818N111_9BILA|nr:unnamed protein product [Adineta steineri]CAF3598774.1 unnamed protein product [Adineta steineri]
MFYYSNQPGSIENIEVNTSGYSRKNVGFWYNFKGDVINGDVLDVKLAECVNYLPYNIQCIRNTSLYLILDGLIPYRNYVLKIISPTARIISIIRDLVSIKSPDQKKFNLTCEIVESVSSSTPKPGNPYSDEALPTTLVGIISLSVCAGLICSICTLWTSIMYYRRFKQQRKDKKLRLALEKSTQQILDKSPIIIYDPNNKDNVFSDDSPMCAICLESFENNEKLRKLVCSHYYHLTCIDPWLLAHQSCPLCNRNILRNSIPSISSSIMDRFNEGNSVQTISTVDNHTTQAQTSNL